MTALWVENSSGQALIAKRSHKKRNHPNLWAPAVAGTVEPGETFEQNIIKVAWEEIGLKLDRPNELFHFFAVEDDGIGRYAVWYKTICDNPVENFILQEEEVDDIRWIDKADLIRELKDNPDKFTTSQGL